MKKVTTPTKKRNEAKYANIALKETDGVKKDDKAKEKPQAIHPTRNRFEGQSYGSEFKKSK